MKKPKRPLSVADELFKSAPPHVQTLHRESLKLQRDVKRKLWWDKKGVPPTTV